MEIMNIRKIRWRGRQNKCDFHLMEAFDYWKNALISIHGEDGTAVEYGKITKDSGLDDHGRNCK